MLEGFLSTSSVRDWLQPIFACRLIRRIIFKVCCLHHNFLFVLSTSHRYYELTTEVKSHLVNLKNDVVCDDLTRLIEALEDNIYVRNFHLPVFVPLWLAAKHHKTELSKMKISAFH